MRQKHLGRGKVLGLCLVIALCMDLAGCAGQKTQETTQSSSTLQSTARESDASSMAQSTAGTGASSAMAQEAAGTGESSAAVKETAGAAASSSTAQETTAAESSSQAESDYGPVSNEDGSVSMDIFAMDTYMTLKAWGDEDTASQAVREGAARIHALDDLLSTGDAASEIAQLNANGGGKVSEDAAYLIRRSLELYQETDGAFDIAIYPVVQLWGFPTGNYRVPSEEEIKEALTKTDASMVTLQADSDAGAQAENSSEGKTDAQAGNSTENQSEVSQDAKEGSSTDTFEVTFGREGMEIDLGGIAKGYTSAQIMDIFRNAGITSGLVSLGGNVQTLGTKTDGSLWRVAIEDPDSTETYLGVLSCQDKAVITSGAYERYFEQDGKIYHHIIDPATGYPAESGIKSSTIVSDDGTLADGLSTSLFIMGLDKAETFWREHSDEFDFILETEDGVLHVTEGIADSFTTSRTVEVVR